MRERSRKQGAIGKLVPDTCFEGGGRSLGAGPWPSRLFSRRSLTPGLDLRARFAGRQWSDDVGCVVVHRTILNMRFQRTATGQRQIIQACSPSAIEKKIIWARPTRFSSGTSANNGLALGFSGV